MLDSLRFRLLLWYALILTVVIVIFGSSVCYLYWRSLTREIDRTLRAGGTAISNALSREPSGYFDLDLSPKYRESAFMNQSPHTYYAVWDDANQLVDRSDPNLALPTAPVAGVNNRNGRREIIVGTASGARILVGRDLSEARREVRSLAVTVGVVGGGVLLLSLSGGWFLAGRALAPIARISRAARAMADGDLSARIAVEQTEDELEQVALALNEGFDRLRLAADMQKQFTADASHELRTPLATLRATLDLALNQPRGSADYVETLQICRRTGDRMAHTVEELLALARGDAALRVRQDRIALATLVQNVVEMLEAVAAEKHVVLETQLEPAYVVGDPARLSEAVVNIVKNSIEYNRDGGHVSIKVSSDASAVHLRVHDTGIGMSAEDLPRVFDRFYRTDEARTRKLGGAGLGLAIAKRFIEEHGGIVSCHSRIGLGTDVVVRLPQPCNCAES